MAGVPGPHVCRNPRQDVVECKWCFNWVQYERKIGRPKQYCSKRCEDGARNWRRTQWYRDLAQEQKEWWIGLTHEQRVVCMRWVEKNPCPKAGVGKQGWAHLNREEILNA